MRTDVYERVADQIVAELERGVRPWMKPWNAEQAEGRITRPLRANGIPYQGINVLMLWSAAMARRCFSIRQSFGTSLFESRADISSSEAVTPSCRAASCSCDRWPSSPPHWR